MLFASRLVQAISETIIWVVGITVIADVVPIEHIGVAYTTVFMASSAGNSIGPMLSGLLYELAGYWPAWSTAFAIIGLDIVFRLLMIESPNSQNAGKWRVQCLITTMDTLAIGLCCMTQRSVLTGDI